MKKISLEQMEVTIGGDWLNNHSWREHLVCIGFGAIGSLGGPLVTAGAMALCYMSVNFD